MSCERQDIREMQIIDGNDLHGDLSANKLRDGGGASEREDRTTPSDSLYRSLDHRAALFTHGQKRSSPRRLSFFCSNYRTLKDSRSSFVVP